MTTAVVQERQTEGQQAQGQPGRPRAPGHHGLGQKTREYTHQGMRDETPLRSLRPELVQPLQTPAIWQYVNTPFIPALGTQGSNTEERENILTVVFQDDNTMSHSLLLPSPVLNKDAVRISFNLIQSRITPEGSLNEINV